MGAGDLCGMTDKMWRSKVWRKLKNSFLLPLSAWREKEEGDVSWKSSLDTLRILSCAKVYELFDASTLQLLPYITYTFQAPTTKRIVTMLAYMSHSESASREPIK